MKAWPSFFRVRRGKLQTNRFALLLVLFLTLLTLASYSVIDASSSAIKTS